MADVILGTVQLGMDYGIANRQGKPEAAQARAVIQTAWEGGVRAFDTAHSYGDSERVLGQALRALGVIDQARISTKLAPTVDPADCRAVEESLQLSFERLGSDRLWCLLLHRAAHLEHWDEGLGEVLRSHRAKGHFQHVGVSVTLPEEAVRWWSHPDMEVLQVACNAWDRRMIDRGIFESMRGAGKVCCARSIYLQGLLTLPPKAVADRLPIAYDAAVRWSDCCARWEMDPKTVALRFAAGLDVPLVIGAESPEQIAETLALLSAGPLPEPVLDDLRATFDGVFAGPDGDRILTPMLWPHGT